MRLHIVTTSLCLSTACILPGSADDDGTDATAPASTSTGAADSSSGGTSATTAGTSTAVPTGDSSDSGDASDDGTTSDTDDTGSVLGACVDAINFEGNPFYNGDFENGEPDGQPLLSDPPLRSYSLSAIDDVLAVGSQTEVWIADSGAQSMRRILGDANQDNEFVPAQACDDVRPLLLRGVTTRPGGSLVIADNVGNSLLELTDPLGDCTAQVIAGNAMSILDYEIEDGAAFAGDVDGPGATAQFWGVAAPVAVGEDLYVIDVGNRKIKRVAGDADRTVSTLFDYSAEPEVGLKSMTAVGGTLFVTGIEVSDDLLWAIDLATGEREVLFHGRGMFEEIGDSSIANMYSITDDGQDLLIATAQGYIFRVATDGDPIEVIAGYGVLTYYPTDLDVTQPIATADLPIRSNDTITASLARSGSNLYFTGNGGGVGFHIWEIRCGG